MLGILLPLLDFARQRNALHHGINDFKASGTINYISHEMRQVSRGLRRSVEQTKSRPGGRNNEMGRRREERGIVLQYRQLLNITGLATVRWWRM